MSNAIMPFTFEGENKVNSHELTKIFSNESLFGLMKFKPCGTYQESSYGWVSPFNNDKLVVEISEFIVLKLRIQKKILNSKVMQDMLEIKVNEYIDQVGMKPESTTIKGFKEQIKDELVSSERAQVGSEYVQVVIDTKRKLLLMDTTSGGIIKVVLDCLSNTFTTKSSYPVTPIINVIESNINATLTTWLNPDNLHSDLELFDSAMLMDVEGKNKTQHSQHNLLDSVIAKEIEQGKIAQSLGLTWQDKINFVINDKCQVKQIKLADKEDTETQLSMYSDDIAGLLECVFESLGGFKEIQQDSLLD